MILAVVLLCAALRIVLYVLHLTDPGSYYVWPADAALSVMLFLQGRRHEDTRRERSRT